MTAKERERQIRLLDGIQAAMELLMSAVIDYRKDVLMERVDYIDEQGYVHWKKDQK